MRWLREVQSTLHERRPERARQLLRLQRQARQGAGPPELEAREGPGRRAAGLEGAPRQGWPRTGAQAEWVPRGGCPWLQGWATEKEGGRAAGWGEGHRGQENCEGGGEGRGPCL